MALDTVSAGRNPPAEFNVIIEIPMNSDPVKYEVDKKTGALFVDRFLSVSMRYPANYGYVPQTLSGDGDPVDVLVLTPFPLQAASVIPCRALGVLKMEDESGIDFKVLAVPTEKILPIYGNLKTVRDLHPMQLEAISHFFAHYKDLEKNKWVKLSGWDGPEAAHHEITEGVAAYQEKHAR